MKTWAVVGLLLCAPLCAADTPPAPASNTAEAARRDLWLGDEGRYVRRWLLLGPLSAREADQLARPGSLTYLDPTPGREQRIGDRVAPAWREQGTYGDILDGFSGSGMKDGEVGLAFAVVDRATTGPATLLVGGNVRGVWVNQQWIGGASGSSGAFVVDGQTFTTRLVQGANRIVLRIERADRPPLVSLRVVEPGFTQDRPGNVAPYIPEDGPARLRVLLGVGRDNPGEQVSYDVIAAGGQAVATRRAHRQEPVEFASRGWKDGAYEVRVSTRSTAGVPVVTWLPWYKGDAKAAGERLLAAAALPGADAQVQMLAAMVKDRGLDDWRGLHSPLMEYEELLLERAGKAGGARAGGFVRLAWTDDIDASPQFCRAYLPDPYPAKAPSPALIFLHGYNPPNPAYVRWWSIGDRHNGVADRHALIVLEPMGRGNVDYRWMGERDVLRCLAEAKRRFPIDADRVYLTGESMGGNGTWLIASRNPQEFAAAAPVFGGWDYRINVNGYNYTNPDATRPMERFLQEAHSSFAGAEGLRNVPMYVLQGAADTSVPVEQSRHGVQLLQRWGYDVRYREIPGRGHEDLKARDEIADWLLTHRRDPAPREVRLRSYDLAGARAHWLRITGWENPLQMIEARAVVLDDQTIRVDTRNVSSFEITPPPGIFIQSSQVRSGGGVGDVAANIIWNGRSAQQLFGAGGPIRLVAEDFKPTDGDKTPAREGRLTYFFNTPFAIVVGTKTSDAALSDVLATKSGTFAEIWDRWQHLKPRIFSDTDVTPEIEKQYSLLLLGGPDANSVSARLAASVPLTVTRDSVTVDGRRFAASDAVAQVLYPHPRNPGRYLLMVAPTSAAGMRYWNPQQYWHALNGFPMNLWDWTIVDGRHAMQAPGLFPDRGWVAAGLFDMHWRRDDRFTVLGDPELRANARLRHPPPPGFKLPDAARAVLFGKYQINPGQIGAGGLITVDLSCGSLSASAPEGGRAWPLEAESESDFAILGIGTPVTFLRDGAGAVTGLVYDYNGQQIVATKLP